MLFHHEVPTLQYLSLLRLDYHLLKYEKVDWLPGIFFPICFKARRSLGQWCSITGTGVWPVIGRVKLPLLQERQTNSYSSFVKNLAINPYRLGVIYTSFYLFPIVSLDDWLCGYYFHLNLG